QESKHRASQHVAPSSSVFALRCAAAVPLSSHARRVSETETRVQWGVVVSHENALALQSATNPRSSTSNATCVRIRSSKLRRGARTFARSVSRIAVVGINMVRPARERQHALFVDVYRSRNGGQGRNRTIDTRIFSPAAKIN